MKDIVEKRLMVAGIGDPRSYATWAGTPLQVIEALEVKGCHVDAIDCSDALDKATKLRLMIGYQGSRWQAFAPTPGNIKRQTAWLNSEARSDYSRSRRARAAYAAYLQQRRRQAKAAKVLYMTSLALPLAKDDSGTQHFLMCDSTWHTLSAFSNVDNRFTSATLRDFEDAERASFQSVEHFFPTAEYVRDDLINHYGIAPHRITVVGTGRGKLATFEGNKDYASGHILFVAKARFAEKGGALLIEAFKRAQQAMPHLKLTVVGQESYREMAVNVPNLTFHGYVEWDELQSLFNSAALFAMPATAEPWGLVYLEAMGCKTPILGLNRHAIPEFTDNGRVGFVVDRADAKSIAQIILNAFSDVERLRVMGRESQQRCLQKYTWEIVASHILHTMFHDDENKRAANDTDTDNHTYTRPTQELM